MSGESSDDRLRRFRCRDALWDVYEQMAVELGSSVDLLIAESMKAYAGQRGYRLPSAALEPPRTESVVPTLSPERDRTSGSSRAPAAKERGYGGVTPAEPVRRPSSESPPMRPASARPRPLESTPSRLPGLAAFPTHAATSGPAEAPPPPPPVRIPPPPPPPVRSIPPQAAVHNAVTAPVPPPPPPPVRHIGPPPPPVRSFGPTPLAVYYQGVRFAVEKERFIIGRGKGSSDLVIKDPNVSRQHAMIEWHDGHWYIVDMGSTNGIEVGGINVQRKQIEEGDRVVICTHELLLSFR